MQQEILRFAVWGNYTINLGVTFNVLYLQEVICFYKKLECIKSYVGGSASISGRRFNPASILAIKYFQ